MLAITLIAAIACVLLIMVGSEIRDDRSRLLVGLGASGILLLIAILHAARIGAVTL